MAYPDHSIEFYTSLDARLHGLSALPEAERKAAVTALTVELRPYVLAWQRPLARAQNDRGQHTEDLTQEAMLTLWLTISQFAGGKHAEVNHTYPFLHKAVSHAASRFYKSTAVTGISGRVQLERHGRRIASHLTRLVIELGRPATAGELAEAANDDLRSRRRVPSKAGHITERDVRAFLGGAA
jgi:DNA-directed RNA polymerase specialized sigma24 family protein